MITKACYHIMNISKKIYNKNIKPMCSHANIGSGRDITIKELAEIIKKVVGYNGDIVFDKNKPDGLKSFLIVSLLKNLAETKLN